MSLSLVQSHSDPRLSQSVFLQLLIGAVASAGGGVTAATFGVWTPEWNFGTPVVLKSGWVESVDVWGGIIAGRFQLTSFISIHIPILLIPDSINHQRSHMAF